MRAKPGERASGKSSTPCNPLRLHGPAQSFRAGLPHKVGQQRIHELAESIQALRLIRE